MTSRRALTVLAVLGVALLGVILWESRTLARWQGLQAEQEAKRRSLREEIQAVSRRASANRAAAAGLTAGAAQRGVIPAAHADRLAAAVAAAAIANPTLFQMFEHLRQLKVTSVTASVALQWGLFLKQLNLPPDQAAKFLAIQTAVETKKENLYASADEAGESQSDPEIAAQVNDAYAEANRETRALLDPTDYAAFKAYSQYNGTLILANHLAGDLPATDTLTDGQVEQLTQILGHASAVDKNGWIVYGTVNWAAAMPQAQTILTPAQYESLQALAAQKTAEWRLGQLAASYAQGTSGQRSP